MRWLVADCRKIHRHQPTARRQALSRQQANTPVGVAASDARGPNAERYSSMLRGAGHESSLGFASEKNVYYVFVYRSGNLEEAREMRNQYRGLRDFQFPDSWVLTVE